MLTQRSLKQLLDYDPKTGKFRWRVNRGRRSIAGKIAGSIHWQGYRQIKIDDVLYRAGRLAFLYVIGHWPKHEIDHINGNRDDDRWSNLREATRSENMRNSRAYAGKQIKFKGVSWHQLSGKYQASIYRNKNHKIYLGLFPSAQAAHRAYCFAARKHFGDFARFS